MPGRADNYEKCSSGPVFPHETEAQQPELRVFGVAAKQVQVEFVILRFEENLLTGVALLGDVVGDVFHYNASDTRHRSESAGEWVFFSEILCLSVLSRVPAIQDNCA